MKKMILSLLTFACLSSYAQDKAVRLENYSLNGEMVSFEGTDISTGEHVKSIPLSLNSLSSNREEVMKWLTERCYMNELIPAFAAVGFGNNDNVESVNNTCAVRMSHCLQTVKVVNLNIAKEWVRPCPSHVDL